MRILLLFNKYFCLFSFSLLSFLFYLFYFNSSVFAYERLIFSEEFNNLDNWLVLSGTESSILSVPGMYTNLSLNSRNSSYIITKNPFPDTDLKIRVVIRANSGNYTQGAGVVVSDSFVPHGITREPFSGEIIANIWPNNRTFTWGFPSAYCSTGGCFNDGLSPFSITNADSAGWQVVEMVFKSDVTTFSLGSNTYTTDVVKRRPKYIWIGNPHTTNAPQDGFANFQVDRIDVWDISSPTEFSPYYSQKDPAWAGEEYDSASMWAGNDKKGIDQWGCAITSVSMLLSKYGIKSPTGAESNPSVVNSWLRSQLDGYVGNGLMNWLAIARYSKLSK